MPNIEVSMFAIFLAVIANFFLGFLWYSKLFQKIWSMEMGFNPNEKPKKSELFRSMGLALIGYFFLAYVLSHQIAVWNSESWGLGISQWTPLSRAIQAAFFTWLGFFVPMLLNSVAWAKHSWKLFLINASYHLIALFVVALILVFMG